MMAVLLPPLCFAGKGAHLPMGGGSPYSALGTASNALAAVLALLP